MKLVGKSMFFLLLVATAALAQPSSWRDDAAVRETLITKGPLLGHRWLEKTGREDYLLRQCQRPDSQGGLVCTGRWSYGPSLKVSLRVTPDDTIICLTRGSGASLIRFRSQDSVTLQLLGDVDFAGMPRRAVLSDTLVIAGIHSGGSGLEIHGVSNPASPNLLSRTDLPMVNDIAVNDTLVYVACEDDTLRIYNIANPRAPTLVGACRDSCDLYMSYADGYCYLVHVSGVNIVDVRNPMTPHRAGHIGGEPLAAFVRDTMCYVTIYQDGLHVYNIRDPGTPQEVGSLAGSDVFDVTMAAACDTALYTPALDCISVADPTHPRLLGRVSIRSDYPYGVAVVPSLRHALVADYYDGVIAVDITNTSAPQIDAAAFAAGQALDVVRDQERLYVGSYHSGLTILDVTDPARPARLGSLDYLGRLPSCLSVEARDSFAFVPWDSVPQLRTVSVADPHNPVQAGGCDVWDRPEDMVLRDTLLYCAMPNRFQIINIARPREPALVGGCVGDGVAVVVQDSFAYTAAGATRITNIARPDSPYVVSTISGHSGSGIAVRDTFLYISAAYDTLWVYGIANPASPHLLGFAPVSAHTSDVALAESTAAVTRFNGIDLFSLQNPAQPRRIGGITTPYGPRRVVYSAPYWYVAMWDAGVGVYKSESLGVAEERGGRTRDAGPTVTPNPTRGVVVLQLPDDALGSILLRDVSGRRVLSMAPTTRTGQLTLDLGRLPAGVYFVEVRYKGEYRSVKVVRN
jgi:hypothetical protein